MLKWPLLESFRDFWKDIQLDGYPFNPLQSSKSHLEQY